MKRMIALLMLLIMVLSLTACGNGGRNDSEKHGYYKGFEWGLSRDAVSEKLQEDGLELVENLGLLDISKFNIQKPCFTVGFDGDITCYNVKFLDKYNPWFISFNFDKDKLAEVSIQLDGYYSVEDYEAIKAELGKKLGEIINKDDELGLLMNMHTAEWKTDVSDVSLNYTEGTVGKGMISITYDELAYHEKK